MQEFLKIYDYASGLEWLPQFLLGILSFFLTGHLVLCLTKIKRPECGAMALEIAVGQFVFLIYVSLRLALSTLLNAWPVHAFELFLIPAILGILASRQKKIERKEFHKIIGSNDFLFTSLLLLIVYALRVPYWFTASSDPDVHAYFSRIIFEKRMFFSSLPHSDVRMTYPFAFSILNLVWHLVSQLNAVAIVNIQPLLQVIFCAGSVLAIFEKLDFFSQTRDWFARQLSVFLFFLLCWNPIFMTGHEFSEGTARLCCTSFYAILVYWIVCVRQTNTRLQAFLCLGFAAFAAAFCFWLNPSLGPMALLLFFGFAFYQKLQARYWFSFGILFVVVFGFLSAFDPYYHSLFFSHSPAASPNQIHQAGSLLRPAQEWLEWPRLLKQVSNPFHFLGLTSNEVDRKASVALLLFTFGFISLLGFKRLRNLKPSLPVVFCSLSILFLHHLWCALLRQVVSLQSLNGILLVSYTEKVQLTTWRIFLASFLSAALIALIPLLKIRKWPTYVVMISIYLLAVPAMDYFKMLSLSGLGVISIQEHTLIEKFSNSIGADDRVILSCRLMITDFEKWPMPFGAGRLLPLLSDRSTAFFFGHDGKTWTTEAYQEHVMKKLDLGWAKEQQLRWLIWFDGAEGPPPLAATPSLKLFGSADHIQIFEIPKNE